MSKFLTVLCFIVFDICLIVLSSKLTFAAPDTSTVSPTPTKSEGQNPAPPLFGSFICGKTVCLENEACVKYPEDIDEHCVAIDIDPEAVSADPIKNKLEDCNKILGNNQSVFPPNSKCWNNTVMIEKDLSKFEKTCVYQPEIIYTDTRYLKTKGDIPGFEECGNGSNPYGGTTPGDSKQDKCYIGILVYTDVRDATLGSYGPDEKTILENSSDYLAQNYLYNSLFGRPNSTLDTNKEAYRTYWRLLPAENQANLRSFTLNMSKQGLMENTNFDFNGKAEKTDLVDLYNQLSKQIIVFLHPPFIRIGCLTDYPVCPEFAKAQADFNTPISDNINFINSFPFPIALEAALSYYGSVTDESNKTLSTKYSSFTPLDFTSVRNYIFRKPTDEIEAKIYNGLLDGLSSFDGKLRDTLNQPRYGTNKPLLNSVTSESTPYVGAIYQGLLSPKFGIMGALQPQWLIDKYATPEGSTLYDYAAGNTPQDYPEVKISAKNFLTRITDELAAFVSNPFSWTIDLFFGEKDKSFSEENVLTKGYNEPRVENEKTDVKNYYQNMLDCPLPISYHISAPFTANLSKDPLKSVSKDDHHQVIYIRGNNVQWDFNPEKWDLVEDKIDPVTGEVYQVIKRCPKNDEHFQKDGEPNTCYKRRWSLTAKERGNTLTVLNNPKQSDIKKAVVSDSKFSLYNTLLPSILSVKKITSANIDAPIARNFVSQNGGGDAVGPSGEAKMLNPAEPINRINNQAQDSMHLLQNCWVVPDKLQNSPRCKIALADSLNSEVCNGEKFKEIIGDNDLVISQKGKDLFYQVKDRLSDDLLAAYAEAEKQTGVPCEVLAGIHYREADNSPDQDLQSGAALNGRSLTESAIQAANELLGKAGGKIGDIDTLIRALSWYNGGGNANCQATTSCSAIKNNRCGSKVACDNLPPNATHEEIKAACTCGIEAGSCRSQCDSGYPFLIPTSPGLCPPPSTGYDDPYVVELWKKQHEKMYVLFQYDCTQTPPINQNRLGTFTFAVNFYQEITDVSSGPSTITPAESQ